MATLRRTLRKTFRGRRGGGSAPTPSTLLDGLVLQWKMNEAAGIRFDSMGSNDLTDNNTVGSQAGKILVAADFEEANDEYLSIADNTDISLGDIDFEWSTWVWLESKGNNRVVLSQNEPTSSTDPDVAQALAYNLSLNRFRFSVGNGVASFKAVIANSLGGPDVGQWYFIQAWHDSVGDSVNIRVNNGSTDSEPYSTGSYDSTGPLIVGGLIDTGSLFVEWDGKIDVTKFWKRNLTEAERLEDWNSGAGVEL